jgi:hypothetical protein
MNKLEFAIEECKNSIKRLELEKIMVQVELDTYKKQLDSLERISRNHSIPHDDQHKPITLIPVDEINVNQGGKQ